MRPASKPATPLIQASRQPQENTATTQKHLDDFLFNVPEFMPPVKNIFVLWVGQEHIMLKLQNRFRNQGLVKAAIVSTLQNQLQATCFSSKPGYWPHHMEHTFASNSTKELQYLIHWFFFSTKYSAI